PVDNDFDIVGNTRIRNNTVDLGAYEYQIGNIIPNIVPSAMQIVFVRSGGNGLKNGNSWANAVGELADVLLAAKNNANIKEIWVAAGTYKPKYSPADNNFGTNLGRDNSFLLVNNVKIYGGFAATGTPIFADRNPKQNVTLLSGDINGNNAPNSTDNYHVLMSVSNDQTALLDGFTVSYGFAVGSGGLTVNSFSIPREDGGGIILYASSPIISNCSFIRNIASTHGGAISNLSSSPTIANSIFKNNESQSGGAIYNYRSSSPKIYNTLFVSNVGNYGSEIQNYDGGPANSANPLFYNCTFYSTTLGAKIYNDGTNAKPKFTNCILWGGDAQIQNDNAASTDVNYSIVAGGHAGTNNINSDPLFTNVASDDFTLTTHSPAIDAGDPSATLLDIGSKDLNGNDRFQGSAIDIGAFETNTVLPIELISFNAVKEMKTVRLSFTTNFDADNAKFVISRSTNGKNFEVLTTILPNTLNTYTYIDQKPANGNNYFLLQHIDVHGKIYNLGIKHLVFESVSATAYPNPTAKSISVSFMAGIYQLAQLIDLNGKILRNKILLKNDTLTDFDLSEYPSSMFFIRLKGFQDKTFTILKK
ncbi:T9SS type A sorting domain-containing protein, partial [Pedobacter sp. ASV28]|uniref:T9SS type A sorting domain-containing protein n=1 Tax=Pedobacter sp. ASV28 TaxID=2795123 RepID=UPI001E2ABBE4